MPIIKSAKKRVKVASKARARNVKTKRILRDSLKAYSKALQGGKSAEIAKAQATAVSALDMAAKKNILHKNRAARTKARLSAQAKSAGAKPAKASDKKPTPKKPAAKKTSTRKTAAKK